MGVSKKQREQVYKKYNERCAYCGQKIEYKNMQVDHIKPKYLGGKNETENYLPTCRACNFYKSTFSLEEFRKRIETIPDRLNKIFIFKLAIKYGLIKITNKKIKFLLEQNNGKEN